MAWPWVSRALYEKVAADLEESNRERKELLQRLLGGPITASGLTADEVAKALTTKAEEDPNGLFEPVMSPETPSGLRKMAQAAAYKAQTLGSRIT